MLERGSPREPRALCLTSVYPPGHHMVRRGGLRLRGRGESALLCAPLAVGGRGARHSTLSYLTRCTLLSRRSLGLGGVSVNAAEATKGVTLRLLFYIVIDSVISIPCIHVSTTQSQNVTCQRPRAARALSLSGGRGGPCSRRHTRDRSSTTQVRSARTPTAPHPKDPRPPDSDNPVCGETRDSTHDTSTIPYRVPPSGLCSHA